VNKLSKLLSEGKILEGFIEEGDMVAIKMHWGDHGTMKTIRSVYVRELAIQIQKYGGIPFVTETSGLGLGFDRNSGLGRLIIARENGYTSETVQADLLPADGIKGEDYVKVNFNGAQLKEVYIARAIMDADKIISLAHVKGHPRAGMGGAIKNMGVGSVAKRSKFNLHFYNETPEINPEKCNQCGKCAEICPVDAIDVNNKLIKKDVCVRCYGCGGKTCPTNAIEVEWCNAFDTNIRILDCANAVLNAKGPQNFRFINFLVDISPICDCVPFNDHSIVQDIGICAAKSMIAIDKASYDLINNAPILANSAVSDETKDIFAQMYENTTKADFRDVINQIKKKDPNLIQYKLIEI
jgi:hypothetical protein